MLVRLLAPATNSSWYVVFGLSSGHLEQLSEPAACAAAHSPALLCGPVAMVRVILTFGRHTGNVPHAAALVCMRGETKATKTALLTALAHETGHACR